METLHTLVSPGPAACVSSASAVTLSARIWVAVKGTHVCPGLSWGALHTCVCVCVCVCMCVCQQPVTRVTPPVVEQRIAVARPWWPGRPGRYLGERDTFPAVLLDNADADRIGSQFVVLLPQ